MRERRMALGSQSLAAADTRLQPELDGIESEFFGSE
jgi:hypothetical protein